MCIICIHVDLRVVDFFLSLGAAVAESCEQQLHHEVQGGVGGARDGVDHQVVVGLEIDELRHCVRSFDRTTILVKSSADIPRERSASCCVIRFPGDFLRRSFFLRWRRSGHDMSGRRIESFRL